MPEDTEGAGSALIRRLEQHRRTAMSHAMSILGNYCDAEDCVQVALLNAWKASGEYRGESAERTWYISIVRNAAYTRLRERVADKRGGGCEILSIDSILNCSSPCTIEEDISTRETIEFVSRGMSNRMKSFVNEVLAGKTNLTSTEKVRMHRARKHMAARAACLK